MGESLSTKIETIQVCHALLQTPQFFSLLVQIDAELAAVMHGAPCRWCGDVLHRANSHCTLDGNVRASGDILHTPGTMTIAALTADDC